MNPTREELAPIVETLHNAYRHYVTTVSLPQWAVSPETAALIEWACIRNDPVTVCDLGSGFTSYVLRRYAEGRGVAVTSVDHDGDWLARTEAFLYEHDLPTTDCVLWRDWLDRDDLYDLIVVDMAIGDLRNDAIKRAPLRLNRGGLIIFDDAQSEHQPNMSTAASDHDLRFNILCQFTDGYKRYPAVAW